MKKNLKGILIALVAIQAFLAFNQNFKETSHFDVSLECRDCGK